MWPPAVCDEVAHHTGLHNLPLKLSMHVIIFHVTMTGAEKDHMITTDLKVKTLEQVGLLSIKSLLCHTPSPEKHDLKLWSPLSFCSIIITLNCWTSRFL